MPLLLPFFKFDVQAWLTSETVSLMTNEQGGAFIKLLAKCWATATCTLPNDAKQVRSLADWTGSDDHFVTVFQCFKPLKATPDRLYNTRLMKEWKEARKRHLFYAERAKAGATARWETKKPAKKRVPAKSPTDWLAAIRANAAYAHIDIERELSKMDAWLSTKSGRQKTKGFVVNWLNKIEPPLSNGHGTTLTCPHHPKLTFPDKAAKDTHDYIHHPKYVG